MLLFADPYTVFTAALLTLFGISGVLVLLLKRQPLLAWPLSAAFGVSAALWIGLWLLDTSRLYAIDIRPDQIAARWVVFPAAIILLLTGSIVTGVYGEHTGSAHAWEYRMATRLIVLASLCLLVGFILQPLFS